MGTIVRNTAYEVRPNIIEADDLTLLKKEEGVIVYNKTDKKLYTTDGLEWSELGGLPTATANDVLIGQADGTYVTQQLNTVIGNATLLTQGYYGMLSSFYFGGTATDTVIDINNVNTWLDVELTTDANGLFDKRPLDMITAQANGHTGTGASGDPIIFNLEGLDVRAFANFRASLAFEPSEDEGKLETRLLFNRHSGTVPSEDFAIEEVSLTMQSGADIDYASEPMLSFFIGDTIDTNGVNDAGKCRFQIKSNVEGTLKLRALTWYINK